ncbi:MAG: cysteine--tRNA ligase [Alphaproteobacteria bacterium]|nr:MAG: cysteine--tRNA ligase [Rickettsiaceae bacterium 4572_127]
MKLFLYNTLTREKEEFKPYDKNEVKMYTCGPTVYWYQHIGNMFAYVCADTIKKTLQFAGYKVNHVMGVTDVGHLVSDDDDGEDKMEKGAKRENISVWDLAQKYTDQFFKDTKSLNITKPATICKATDYIQEQIDAVKTLENKGLTYQTSDGIYFDSSKDTTYGELARLDIDGLQAGERVEMAEKKNKTDFALWKFSPKNEKRQMEWDSPWGIGFPGWHIECSSFCLSNLGENIDIHTGGIDHIPVHHTNEIAQNKGITGHKVVNYWLHSNHVVKADGSKISKSDGDKMLVEDFANAGFDPLAYRYLVLMAHYRKKVKFSAELLKMADTSLKRLKNKIIIIKKEAREQGEETEHTKIWLDKFKTILFDDFNTAQAMTFLRLTIDSKGLSDKEKLFIVQQCNKVLSLNLGKQEQKCFIPNEVQELAEKRLLAKKNKNWELADTIRNEIEELGFCIEDTSNGYEIKEK